MTSVASEPAGSAPPARPSAVRARVWRIVVLLLLGVFVGGVIGVLFTGDWIYMVVWPIAMSLLFFVAGFSGRATAARVLTRPGRVPGIIDSRELASRAAAPAEAVLNPESTAVPSTGATLNGQPVAVTPPPKRSGGVPWGNRALAIGIVLVAIAVTLIPAYRMIGWTAGNIAHGRWDGNDMRTGLHQQEAVDQIAEVVGSHDFVAVNFYDSYVLVEAPTTPGATTTDQYEWRYGRANRVGPYSGTVVGVFDGSRIDYSIVADLVAQARADTGWTDFTYFYPAVRENSDGVVEILVSIGNDYYSASYTFSAEGELIDRYGTGLD